MVFIYVSAILNRAAIDPKLLGLKGVSAVNIRTSRIIYKLQIIVLSSKKGVLGWITYDGGELGRRI